MKYESGNALYTRQKVSLFSLFWSFRSTLIENFGRELYKKKYMFLARIRVSLLAPSNRFFCFLILSFCWKKFKVWIPFILNFFWVSLYLNPCSGFEVLQRWRGCNWVLSDQDVYLFEFFKTLLGALQNSNVCTNENLLFSCGVLKGRESPK